MSDLTKLSDEELRDTVPHDEQEADAIEAEQNYREWCREMGYDPDNLDNRELYKDVQFEGSWEAIDAQDIPGYEDMMTND